MNINEYANTLLLAEPDLSEAELQKRVDGYIAVCWRKETPEGREFDKYFASRTENVEALAGAFDLLDQAVSFESLSAAYRTLRQNGRIQSEREIEQARLEARRKQDEANRLAWEQSCDAWIDNHSTLEIRERASKDPAFRAYLKAANRIPELPVEYSKENLARQRAAEKIEKQRDRQHADIPAELFTFAEAYKHLPAKEALRRMRTEPMFKANVSACVSAGIL